MSEWQRVIITLPQELSDIAAEFIISVTSRGVEVEDTACPEQIRITAWLSKQDMANGLLHRVENFVMDTVSDYQDGSTVATIQSDEVKEENWAEKWKEFFRPVRAGRSFVIKPQWEPFEAGVDDLVIEIDPGQAFGVGTHATTALMLENIEWLWDTRAWGPDFYPSVLDVGTGTGILGIAATMKGVSRVQAIDVDPQAVRTAAENAVLNGVDRVMTVNATPLAQLSERFDVVLANIDRDTLKVLAADLARRVSSSGVLMVSGILREQQPEVTQIFREQGLSVTRTSTGSGAGDTGTEEWACLVMAFS